VLFSLDLLIIKNSHILRIDKLHYGFVVYRLVLIYLSGLVLNNYVNWGYIQLGYNRGGMFVLPKI